MDVELSRGCWRMKMSKATRIGGVLTARVAKNCGNWFATGCGICGWPWDKGSREAKGREIEWAPPKEATLVFVVPDPQPEEYGPWRKAAEKGRARGRFGAAAFEEQENGTLRCPAGASLWLSEVRQETPFTQRAVYLAYQTDCQPCSYREQCLGPEAKSHRARRVSAVRRLLPAPSVATRTPIEVGSMRWVDVAGRALRRTWTTHWRRQYVEVLPLEEVKGRMTPPPRAPRSVRSRHRWNWQDRLAQNAWWGPPRLRITVAGVPTLLAGNER